MGLSVQMLFQYPRKCFVSLSYIKSVASSIYAYRTRFSVEEAEYLLDNSDSGIDDGYVLSEN
jgi:hypothetical protein